MEGYKWTIENRNSKKGGGLAILIKDNLKHLCKITKHEGEAEAQWITLTTKTETLTIGNFYGS